MRRSLLQLRASERVPRSIGSVRLDARQCWAGDRLSGELDGAIRGTTIALVRVELRPRDASRIVVAEAPSSAEDGRFVLSVPPTALPSGRGRACRLGYVAGAEMDGGVAFAEVGVSAGATPHLDARVWYADRFLLDHDARHFHIELCEADARGGGRLAGRVHVHRDRPVGPFLVTARCRECWRPAVAGRGVTCWNDATLWTSERTVMLADDACWARFDFPLPPALPPAVEARTIAWRYELVARARVGRWRAETAAVTPLLHEESRPDAWATTPPF